MPLKINLSPPKLARGLRMSPLAQRGGLSQVGGLVFCCTLPSPCPQNRFNFLGREGDPHPLEHTFSHSKLMPFDFEKGLKIPCLKNTLLQQIIFLGRAEGVGLSYPAISSRLLLYRPAKQEGAEPTSEQAINQLTSKESCSFSSLNNESKDHF